MQRLFLTSPQLIKQVKFFPQASTVLQKYFVSKTERVTNGYDIFFFMGNCLCHPSVMVRTELMQKLGGYRYNFTQLTDFDMWVRVAKSGNIFVDEEKLTSFRVA
jgi:hypothetical protein